jgi:hypothetical protein
LAKSRPLTELPRMDNVARVEWARDAIMVTCVCQERVGVRNTLRYQTNNLARRHSSPKWVSRRPRRATGRPKWVSDLWPWKCINSVLDRSMHRPMEWSQEEAHS